MNSDNQPVWRWFIVYENGIPEAVSTYGYFKRDVDSYGDMWYWQGIEGHSVDWNDGCDSEAEAWLKWITEIGVNNA